MTQSRSLPSPLGNSNNTHNHNNKSTKLPSNSSRTFPISKPLVKINFPDIVHDPNNCMFKVRLDTKGNSGNVYVDIATSMY